MENLTAFYIIHFLLNTWRTGIRRFGSATSEQSPLCSSFFEKSHARRACSVASALAMAYCRCQLFASYGSSIPISQKPKIPFSYPLGMDNDEKRPKVSLLRGFSFVLRLSISSIREKTGNGSSDLLKRRHARPFCLFAAELANKGFYAV